MGRLAEEGGEGISFEIVQRIGLDEGLVDNRSASIDGVFQGLQFAYRLKDRGR